MVKANEIREGNYYYYRFDEEEEILKASLRDVGGWDLYYFHPIPLTPEILEKAGFRKYDIGETDAEDHWILPVDPGDENNYLSKFSLTNEMEYKFRDDAGDKSIKIESLHQLQNLIFAHTGEELKIDL